MQYKDTLVEIVAMPSVGNLNASWPDQVSFSKSQGIILKNWSHWIDHIECKGQFLDILVNGQVVRYWRPSVPDLGNAEDFDLGDPGFWEVTGDGTRSYEIFPVQSAAS